MKKFNGFILILLLAVWVSCGRPARTQVELITFDPSEVLAAIDLFAWSFVELEDAAGDPIGVIRQIEKVDDRYYILDGTHQAYVYDAAGNFISRLGRKGRAAGEYVLPANFTINPYRKSLEVLDIGQQKIIRYNLESNAFMEEERMVVNGQAFEYLNSKNIIWQNSTAITGTTTDNYGFFLTDLEQDILREYIARPFKSGYGVGPFKTIYRTVDGIRAFTPFEPNLYRIDYDTARPVYTFEFKGSQLPPLDFLQKAGKNNRDYTQDLSTSRYVSYYNVFETRTALCVPYMINQERFIGLYDKKQKRSYAFDMASFNRILGVEGLVFTSGNTEEAFIACLYLDDVPDPESIANYRLRELLKDSDKKNRVILGMFQLK